MEKRKKNENFVVFLVILHKKVKISFKIDKLFLLKDNYKNQSYLGKTYFLIKFENFFTQKNQKTALKLIKNC